MRAMTTSSSISVNPTPRRRSTGRGPFKQGRILMGARAQQSGGCGEEAPDVLPLSRHLAGLRSSRTGRGRFLQEAGSRHGDRCPSSRRVRGQSAVSGFAKHSNGRPAMRPSTAGGREPEWTIHARSSARPCMAILGDRWAVGWRDGWAASRTRGMRPWLSCEPTCRARGRTVVRPAQAGSWCGRMSSPRWTMARSRRPHLAP